MGQSFNLITSKIEFLILCMPGILLNYNIQRLVSVASTNEEMKLQEEVLVASPEIFF